jgi:hypothetical protein
LGPKLSEVVEFVKRFTKTLVFVRFVARIVKRHNTEIASPPGAALGIDPDRLALLYWFFGRARRLVEAFSTGRRGRCLAETDLMIRR